MDGKMIVIAIPNDSKNVYIERTNADDEETYGILAEILFSLMKKRGNSEVLKLNKEDEK